MNSWQVLREAADRIGVKALAARLNLSTALVYKWCQEPPSDQDPDGSGARNPLDRLRAIYAATGDPNIINWLCKAAEGFFVPNPVAHQGDTAGQLLVSTHRMVQEFGELLTEITRGIDDDGRISGDEAARIRRSWERLKSQAEQFVVACERGFYDEAATAAES